MEHMKGNLGCESDVINKTTGIFFCFMVIRLMRLLPSKLMVFAYWYFEFELKAGIFLLPRNRILLQLFQNNKPRTGPSQVQFK